MSQADQDAPSDNKPSSIDDASPYFVAVDLGSNSFHMLIAKLNKGQLEIVDRVKDMVQIARGIQNNARLANDAIERALTCLECFKERIRQIPASQVRAVGTKALRMVDNAEEFLARAEQALGHPIRIISGYEEARLVYAGVAHTLSNDPVKRLVVDIGGGSTEFIIGQQMQPWLMESLSIGCVTYTENYFAANTTNNQISSGMLRNAYLQTCAELELIVRRYKRTGWDIAIGTSGTMRAISDNMPEQTAAGVITQAGLQRLYQAMLEKGGLQISGLTQQRLDVLPAGIAILLAIFDQLGLSEIHVATASLKEGLIYDTIGRLHEEDTRDITVKDLLKRYRVDKKQAKHVSRLAQHLFGQLNPPPIADINLKKLLKWAAKLHEIGLSISHSGYHQHGFYLLANSDLAGFTQFEQQILSILVGGHRRKFKNDLLAPIDTRHKEGLLQAIVALRLAVILNRRREKISIKPAITIEAHDIYLTIERDWLDQHPLTQRSLSQEGDYLGKIQYSLWVNDVLLTPQTNLTATTSNTAAH